MAVKALLGGSLTTLVLMVVACQSPDPVVEDAPAVLSTSEVTKNHSGAENSAKPDKPEVDLLTAIGEENVTVIKQHMAYGSNPDQWVVPQGIDWEGAFALHLAAIIGNTKIVGILLDNGANINIRALNKDKATPVQWATVFLQKDVVALLVERGAELNTLDANGSTALDTAAFMVRAEADEDKKEAYQEIWKIISEAGGNYSK